MESWIAASLLPPGFARWHRWPDKGKVTKGKGQVTSVQVLMQEEQRCH